MTESDIRVLVTGFDPFGGESVNPAWEAVQRLPDVIAGAEVLKLEVPTVFEEALGVLRTTMEGARPDLVLGVGQAGGRSGFGVERVAINVNDARIEDNAGNQPVDTAIIEGGPAAYFATVPIKPMVAAIQGADLPASVSNSAGTFVCNHLMYGILHFLAQDQPGARGGFIHVPYIPEQVVQKPAKPSMALTDIVRGLEAAVAAAVTHSGGTNSAR
jgi:pyroglutamyl-peptidase